MTTWSEGPTVESIKGIGSETAVQLHAMGIRTVVDLMEYLPYRYDDFRLRDLEEVAHDERVTVEGKVHSEPALMFYGRKKSHSPPRDA